MPQDTWLYGNTRQRRAVRKAAVESRGLLEASSDSTYRLLTEDPRERADRAARITNWGGAADQRVSVFKSGDGKESDDPPASRQLRDPFTTFYVQGVALEPPLPPDRLLNLTEENPLHSACLAAKATDACGRGWSFEPRDGKKGDKDLIQSELPYKLAQAMEDITPDLTFGELLFQAAWEMDAIGWGMWEGVRVGNDGAPGKHGEVAALYPLPSHTMRATLDPRKWVQIRAGRVRYFKTWGAECTVNNETGEVYEWRRKDRKRADELPEEYVASEVIVFRSYTPRSLWYGLPRWISSIATMAELSAIREFNVSWFASGGQVDYHLHFKAATQDMAISLKAQAEETIRENAGRGHTKLFTAGDKDTEVTVNKLGEMLREGHFRMRRTDLIKEMLIAHQTPPYRVGWADTGALGGNAAVEMLGAYSVGTVKPIQTVVEDRLRTTLFDPKKGIDTGAFRLKLKDLDLEDVQAEISMMSAGLNGGSVSPNQWREHMGMDADKDHPELDLYYYQGVPLVGGGGGAPPTDASGKPRAWSPGVGPGKKPAAPGGEQEPGQQQQDQEGDPKEKAAGGAARALVVDMLATYEATLKTALRPARRRPKRG